MINNVHIGEHERGVPEQHEARENMDPLRNIAVLRAIARDSPLSHPIIAGYHLDARSNIAQKDIPTITPL